MEDTFKRLLYAGVGLAAEATDKIQAEIDKLVEKGKMSDVEGKKIVDDFLAIKMNSLDSNAAEDKFYQTIFTPLQSYCR